MNEFEKAIKELDGDHEMNLGIFFRDSRVRTMYEVAGFKTEDSSGFDLVNADEIKFTREYPVALVDLGVIIKPPAGFHCLLMPRSSTFSRYNLLQGNSVGLVDADYCGSKDWWKWSVLWHPVDMSAKTMSLPPGTRLAQFILQPIYKFKTVEYNPSEISHGGFGSTGK